MTSTDVTATEAPTPEPPAPGRPAGRAERTGSRDLGKLWDTWGMTGCLAVLVVVAAILSPDFLTLANIQSVLSESAYLGIVAAAMTVAIINGTFDLSVGGQLALVSVLSLMGYEAGGTALAIAAAIGGGLACGAVNSVLVTLMRVPAFVATLGTLFVFRGIAYILTADNPAVLPYSEINSGFAQLGSARIAEVPVTFIIMVGFFAAVFVFLRRTVPGRRVVAYGSSPDAARFAGVSATRVRFVVFCLLGLAVGIAVLTYITRIWTADGGTQDGFELRVITAAVLGGASLQGGKGSLIGTFSAVLLVAVLNDLMVDQGISAGVQQMVLGSVLIFALGVDGVRTKYAGRARAFLSRRRERKEPLAA
jgi:ribose transport system permease protein